MKLVSLRIANNFYTFINKCEYIINIEQNRFEFIASKYFGQLSG